MGNCGLFGGSTDVSAAVNDSTLPMGNKKKPDPLPDVIDESCTLGALLQSMMPIILPIVRQVTSKNCVDSRMVLRNEIEIEKIDVSKEEELILEPLEFDFGQVSIVSQKTLDDDKKKCPEFQWPAVDLKNGFCLDLTGVRLKVIFAPKIEFKLPVDGPLGMKADVEIGSGDDKSDVKTAFLEVTIPQVRLWYSNVTGERKAHVAFMARPKVTPNLNVNVDRGKGDFMSMDFQEQDGLDDTIESILCGYGPSSLTKPPNTEKNTSEKGSWVADAIGARISSMIMTTPNAPLDVDLEEPIAEAIRIALGKPRPVELVEADIARVDAEKKKHETYKPDDASRELAATTTTAAAPTTAAKTEEKIPENRSTGAFFRTLLPILLPVVRQVVSKNCVADDMVLRKEEKVTTIDVENEAELIVEPLELHLGNTRVVQMAHYEADMKAMPEFKWPKMTPNNGIIWDIINLRLKITWANDIEFAFPVDGPMGMKAMLEIGKGAGKSDVKQAWVELVIPKMRICYDNVKPHRKAYIIFLARPQFTPNINVNADRGKGDFMSMDFQEHDDLDDTIESVLAGFGPSSVTKKGRTKAKKGSWMAEGIGNKVAGSLQKSGADAPYEIDLEDTMQMSIDTAMGIPRPVELIDADLERLAEELKVSKEYYAKLEAENPKKEE